MQNAPNFTIADLRRERGWTLAELADALDIKSRGHAKRIEDGEPCSVKVALKIEALSDGRIPAASLSNDVALVEAARADSSVHAAPDTAAAAQQSPGKSGEVTGAAA